MKPQLWSISGLSVELDIDRRALERKIKDLEPDKSEEKGGKIYTSYYMSRVHNHLMGGNELDITAERARLAKEQADKTEMENKVRRGELIESSKVINDVGGLVHEVKTRLLALPSQLSAYLSHQEPGSVESQLYDGIYEALSGLAGATEIASGAPEEVDS